MIDTNTFKPADSRWQDIFLHLQSAGFDVYPPAVKVGECQAEYIVVKNDGSSRHAGLSTDDDFYAVMCYVPKQAYSSLEPFIQRVKKSMKELEPMILPYGSQTPSYYDDSVKAHMISIQYKNYKKML
jgi:hypothetical protein